MVYLDERSRNLPANVVNTMKTIRDGWDGGCDYGLVEGYKQNPETESDNNCGKLGPSRVFDSLSNALQPTLRFCVDLEPFQQRCGILLIRLDAHLDFALVTCSKQDELLSHDSATDMWMYSFHIKVYLLCLVGRQVLE